MQIATESIVEIETVGDLIKALGLLDSDMPITMSLGEPVRLDVMADYETREPECITIDCADSE